MKLSPYPHSHGTLFQRIALTALLALASPAFADGLVDNVNGITLDGTGQVVRFTGLTVTADGKVGKLIRQGDKPTQKGRAPIGGSMARGAPCCPA